ncbi:MAG: hypothetical protein ACLFV7_13220 [Phycisphaerae bacterium]
MSQAQGNVPIVEVKPQANVYTVLVLVALIALLVGGFVCFQSLTSPVAQGGYGMEVGDLLKPLTEPLSGAK